MKTIGTANGIKVQDVDSEEADCGLVTLFPEASDSHESDTYEVDPPTIRCPRTWDNLPGEGD